MTLTDILEPLTVDTFIRDHVGERALVLKGTEGRFHELVSWQQLNDALSRVRVNDGRVSLVWQSRKPTRESYVHTSRNGDVQYLIGSAVSRYVSQGATLVVNQVDELLPGVRRLAEACEAVFQIYVFVNLYAGWRRDNGFDTHWDRHDTLILQVRGRKDWKVWNPTRHHPVHGESVPPPTQEPFWQGTLEDGDVLYMPRGWWHIAHPRDEPSLHLTFGLSHPTGIDLLTWMVERAKDCVDARMDVPHLKDADTQQAWLGSISAVLAKIAADRPIERYMTDLTVRAHSRPIIQLPETSRTTPPPLDDDTPLRLTTGRRLYLRKTNGSVALSFTASGREWRCDEVLEPALVLLNHVVPCTLTDMRQVVDDRGRALLKPFINALITADVIWAAEPPAPTENAASASS